MEENTQIKKEESEILEHTGKSGKKKWMKYAKIGFLLLVAVFLIRYFYRNYDSYKNLDVEINWLVFTGAILFYFLYKVPCNPNDKPSRRCNNLETHPAHRRNASHQQYAADGRFRGGRAVESSRSDGSLGDYRSDGSADRDPCSRKSDGSAVRDARSRKSDG